MSVIDPPPSDRLLATIRAIIRAEDPVRSFRGIYEYTVQATNGTTVDCDATDTTISLPLHLAKVPIRTSVTGEAVNLPATVVGLRCLVAFVNADPTRPVIIGLDAIPGALPAARQTDAVVAGPWSGTVVGGSANIKIG